MSRDTLPEFRNNLERLLRELRTRGGGRPQIIAERARCALHSAPSNYTTEEKLCWLFGYLPEEWHRQAVLESLGYQVG